MTNSCLPTSWEEDLVALYTCASALCFLRHEGFGLPILEAMSCGAGRRPTLQAFRRCLENLKRYLTLLMLTT